MRGYGNGVNLVGGPARIHCLTLTLHEYIYMNIADIKFPPVLFITGVGTDVGKSIATGWLAREMAAAGMKVITQKMIQTGNKEWSEDILRHREIMGIELTEEDKQHLTAPVIYSYPCSPHLAAAIDERPLDIELIDKATAELASRYPHLLVEGAGGLMVPLTPDFLTADFLHTRQLPTVVVINGQLGAINHALLTLHAVKTYDIPLFGVIYNPFFDKDPIISEDTRGYLQQWLRINFPDAVWIDMPDENI